MQSKMGESSVVREGRKIRNVNVFGALALKHEHLNMIHLSYSVQ